MKPMPPWFRALVARCRDEADRRNGGVYVPPLLVEEESRG